jgi:hypothetical protein
MYSTLLKTKVRLGNKFKPQNSMELTKELKHSFEFPRVKFSPGTETGLNQACFDVHKV